MQPVPREGAHSACTPAARREAGLQRSAAPHPDLKAGVDESGGWVKISLAKRWGVLRQPALVLCYLGLGDGQKIIAQLRFVRQSAVYRGPGGFRTPR